MIDKQKQLESTAKTFPGCCDIYRDNDKVVVTMEMPGVSKENLDIRVDSDKLIINGKKENGQMPGRFLVHEIREGDYHQVFTIDDTIDRNKIEAVIEKGLLTLELGIKESVKPRKIEVSAR